MYTPLRHVRRKGIYFNKWKTSRYKLEYIIRIKVGIYLNNSHHSDKICEICSLLERKPDDINFDLMLLRKYRDKQSIDAKLSQMYRNSLISMN